MATDFICVLNYILLKYFDEQLIWNQNYFAIENFLWVQLFFPILLISIRVFGLVSVGNQDVRLDDERRLYREKLGTDRGRVRVELREGSNECPPLHTTQYPASRK